MRKPATSRHLGRLMTGSILLAGLLLAGLLWLAAETTTGYEPSQPKAITTWSPVTLQNDPRAPIPTEAAPGVIYDPWLSPRPSYGRPPNPTVGPPLVAPRETKRPGGGTLNHLTGQASWYCRAGVSICHYQYPDTRGFDAYAAAGPGLRRAIGPDWRGTVVTVDGIRVKLVDWCGCPEGRIIDLYWDVAHALGISGVGRVTVRW